jgi:hypothetical protein
MQRHGHGHYLPKASRPLAAGRGDGVDRFNLQVLDITDLDQLRLVAEEVLHVIAPGR